MPFVERPNCSSTSAHSTWLQPWPPCSTACRPPLRRAASAALRTASTSASGSTPPASRSASPCSSAMFEGLPCPLAPPAAAGEPEQEARLVLHHLAHDVRRLRDVRV